MVGHPHRKKEKLSYKQIKTQLMHYVSEERADEWIEFGKRKSKEYYEKNEP